MMKKIVFNFTMLITLVMSAGAFASTNNIERIEPGSWWVGMKSDRLQLMVHGDNIAAYTVDVTYPGVRIDSVATVKNRNYVFINLIIQPDAVAGSVDLLFKNGGKLITYPYPLLARVKNSANRKGFSNSDVILNLVPDRFANGDPRNDNVVGFTDRLNRSSNEAGRHGGDIQGIIDHLDYIAAMGYTAIWPTPLIENNQKNYSYHGYAATDTYKIDARFGTNEDFKRMVALAKQKGIGVIQDIVLNHIGSEHWWMKDMPMQDWLSFDGKFVATKHAHSTVSDPYASKEDQKNFTAGWFTENMPDMNQQNPFVATYQIQNSIWWVEYAGLSGIRVDTYGYSDTAFLSEWSHRLTDEYPNLNIVGEEWSLNPAIVSYWQKGKIHANGYVSYLPSLMDFPLNNALRNALVEDESMESGLSNLYKELANDSQYPNPSNLVLFEGNHDVSRLYSVLNDDVDLVKMALAYVLTAPRIPQLYYGTEILMKSKKERDDGAARQDFPGGWAGDKVNAFNGVGLTDEQKNLQNYLKKLLNWRKTQSAIHSGKLLHYTPDQGTYTYFRFDQHKIIMVVLNKNKISTELATKRFSEILGTHTNAVDVLSGKNITIEKSVTVPARSALILEVE
ncbi:glycoside hydrolase family 13 protein [Solimicrobium silvestre]|uniref:Alpha amylase, catalytic domain n=1 Tax=Solimicrobium silvestre TaxID=2099400 RepID=A0A2S9H5F0_9BURK|nr:glycoside hydrolase family 13 protein [Solimicrobium silvestre]PRC95188.1 Alpha amylase, catalytic domain [Solimicrobium silvestre]